MYVCQLTHYFLEVSVDINQLSQTFSGPRQPSADIFNLGYIDPRKYKKQQTIFYQLVLPNGKKENGRSSSFG
jgi:hypothetical protein